MTPSIPLNVKLAIWQFNRSRADYYAYFAAKLTSAGGGIKIMQMFEDDVLRFPGKTRGIIAEFWLQRYSANGANLAGAWEGTLPEDEVAVIRVAQDAGGDAVMHAVKDLARMAKLSDQVKQQAFMTMLAALIGLGVAAAMLTLFPIYVVSTLKKTYDFLPVEFWPSSAKKMMTYSDWVLSYGLYVLGVIALFGTYIHWSFDNLVNKSREWLDKKNVIYRTMRDLKGALFLYTMCTLTRRRGNTMFTLKQSLEIFMESARTPWLKWRIEQIVAGADATGAIDIQAFNTGLLSEDMFYFLEDMEKAKGFSEGLEATANYVEETILERIIKKMYFYRWILLLVALSAGLSVFGWQFSIMYDMRGAMSNYLSSG